MTMTHSNPPTERHIAGLRFILKPDEDGLERIEWNQRFVVERDKSGELTDSAIAVLHALELGKQFFAGKGRVHEMWRDEVQRVLQGSDIASFSVEQSQDVFLDGMGTIGGIGSVIATSHPDLRYRVGLAHARSYASEYTSELHSEMADRLLRKERGKQDKLATEKARVTLSERFLAVARELRHDLFSDPEPPPADEVCRRYGQWVEQRFAGTPAEDITKNTAARIADLYSDPVDFWLKPDVAFSDHDPPPAALASWPAHLVKAIWLADVRPEMERKAKEERVRRLPVAVPRELAKDLSMVDRDRILASRGPLVATESRPNTAAVSTRTARRIIETRTGIGTTTFWFLWHRVTQIYVRRIALGWDPAQAANIIITPGGIDGIREWLGIRSKNINKDIEAALLVGTTFSVDLEPSRAAGGLWTFDVGSNKRGPGKRASAVIRLGPAIDYAMWQGRPRGQWLAIVPDPNMMPSLRGHYRGHWPRIRAADQYMSVLISERMKNADVDGDRLFFPVNKDEMASDVAEHVGFPGKKATLLGRACVDRFFIDRDSDIAGDPDLGGRPAGPICRDENEASGVAEIVDAGWLSHHHPQAKRYAARVRGGKRRAAAKAKEDEKEQRKPRK